MLTILQGSDVHFGRPHDPTAAELFLDEASRINPDVVVIAGDLTQRAKPREYARARAFLDRLGPRPVVVVPGNHDVALYRVWERLGYPFRNYRRHVSPDLDTVVQVPGATFVALNSAAPTRAIVNGRLDAEQIEFAARLFQESPGGDLRCLVMHHPLALPSEGDSIAPLPGGESMIPLFRHAGVDLVLGGHLHRAFTVGGDGAGPGGPLLVHSGTATSTRGRGSEKGQNSFNVIVVDQERIEVTRFLRERSGVSFARTWTESFPRTGC